VDGGPTIPHGASRPHIAHVDTCYLRPILLGKDVDRDLLEDARRLVHSADGRGICASVVVVGEVFLKADPDESEPEPLTPEQLERIGRELGNLVQRGRLRLCGLGCGEDRAQVFACAQEVRAADALIGNLDVMVLASAFSCPQCEVLYTNDGPILQSTELRRLAQEKGVALEEAPSARPRTRPRR
jgi:hypothetical protein